jgi:formylglycine-generating enzyme
MDMRGWALALALCGACAAAQAQEAQREIDLSESPASQEASGLGAPDSQDAPLSIAPGAGLLLSEASAGALAQAGAQSVEGLGGRESGREALLAQAQAYGGEPGAAAEASGSGRPFAAIGKEEIAERIIAQDGLDASHAQALRRALAGARFASQEASPSTRHPMTPAQCRAQSLDAGKLKGGDEDKATCGAPWMAKIPGANVCVDRFEFPNLPCQYPLTWVQARDAAQICESEGKRLCDAKEWEGACVGKAQPPEWLQSRAQHNASREIVWPTGKTREPQLCAVGSGKSPGCDAAIVANKNVREACGTNTWPSGSFPQCGGPLGVYDQMGNAAEHMSLPRNASEQGSEGGHGVTEMKGAWFAFPNSSKQVHPDDCEWREPGWHRTDVMDPRSHANYHLGFRCCKDVAKPSNEAQTGAELDLR